MQRSFYRLAFLLVLAGLVLSACGKAQDGAAQAIEAYLKGVVSKNIDMTINQSCAAWEQQAQIEVDSFGAVTARLEGLSCKETGKDGASSLVACQGKIILTYDQEDQEINLEDRIYKVVQEGGEWRMCGYQ